MALLLATQCNCDKKDAASVNLSLLSVFDRLDWGDGVTYVIGHKTHVVPMLSDILGTAAEYPNSRLIKKNWHIKKKTYLCSPMVPGPGG